MSLNLHDNYVNINELPEEVLKELIEDPRVCNDDIITAIVKAYEKDGLNINDFISYLKNARDKENILITPLAKSSDSQGDILKEQLAIKSNYININKDNIEYLNIIIGNNSYVVTSELANSIKLIRYNSKDFSFDRVDTNQVTAFTNPLIANAVSKYLNACTTECIHKVMKFSDFMEQS